MKKILLTFSIEKKPKIPDSQYISEFILAIALIFLSICLPLLSNAQWATSSTKPTGTGTSTASWSSPVSIYTDNSVYASFSTSTSGGVTSDNLNATNFGFAIPSTAKIAGVEVKINKYASNNGVNNYVVDNALYLVNAGADLSASNYADNLTSWNTTDFNANYGGTNNLWGATLTPAIINSSTFGVRFRATVYRQNGTRTAYVDYIEIKVHYIPDTDGDGITDELDIDTDNDGIADYLETTTSGTTTDLFWNFDGDDVSVLNVTNGAVVATGGLSTTSCYSTAYVSSTAYPALPDNTIYLEQDICSVGQSSTMTINLSYPVTNLTFSIQDIDAFNPQFTDSVIVNVSYKGVIYSLNASNYTVSATYNKFIGSNTFVGLQNANNTTTQGQVLFSFPLMVDKIQITYFNNDPTNGLQAIGLSKLQFKHITNSDSDGDGIPNFKDLDSDNDGVPDVVESYGVDANGDGKIDNFTDANSNGLSDNVATLSATDGLGLPDFDRDGIPNYIDLDSDSDGISDIKEAGGTDADNNNRVDGFTDANGNGYQDALDGASALIKTGSDSNGDGKADTWPNKNNDLIGKPNPYDLDSDGDGITDGLEGLTDTDGDGKPNYLDIDSDNDGITDNVEAQSTLSYKLPVDTDTDDDGVCDVYDGGPSTFGGGALSSFDFDGDGTPDYKDTDTDNDGVPDRNEGDRNAPFKTITQATIDASGDSDGDGLMDVFDNNAITSLGVGNYYKNVTMGNMGPFGNFAGPTPTSSLIGLQQSNPTMDRDWRNATILPISIVSFSANYQQPNTKLTWKVESEYNTLNYEIQYSVNGIDFEKIGSLDAKNTGSVAYSFLHMPSVNNNIIYYRIKQNDKDGKTYFTNIVAIKLAKTTGINIYPNPFKDYFNVNINSEVNETVSIQLFNADGKLIKSVNSTIAKGNNNISINALGSLVQGNYFVRIMSSNIQTTKQLIKTN